MQGLKRELWHELCEKAAVEQDPQRLIELTREINRLLAEKFDRLNKQDEAGSSSEKSAG